MRIDNKIEKKIDMLLKEMTIQEKVGQLTLLSPSIFGTFDKTPDEIITELVEGVISFEEFSKIPRDFHEEGIREGLVGAIGGNLGVKKANELQKIAIEESRLGIPLLFGFDVIHGLRTIFPIPLAEACSWEPELARKSAEVAAKEAAVSGIHWTYAPMVDIARDPRWGRIAEGSGEDTFLGSVFAAARVRGFQGEDLSNPNNILACPKHYAAYGAAIGGRDYNTVDMSLQTLHEVYLPPFESAAKAGAATFMSSFNDLNGVPATANAYLMKHILREQFGFNGFVVSDANAVNECVIHGHSEDLLQASKKALIAGVDMDMSPGTYRDNLPVLLEKGLISESDLDTAARRVLRVKFQLGLFENPYRTDPEREEKTLLAEEHIGLAREIARRSIVLLKNENNLLPLEKMKKIAVVGPLANDADGMLGSWSMAGKAEDTVTILRGIKNTVHSGIDIGYAKGCDTLGCSTEGFDEAISLAERSDVIIAVVGENSDMSGEAGSRMELGLPGVQEVLLKELNKTGKEIIVVLINGRPLSIPWVKEHAGAILEAWQLGVQAGNALADVLFGDYNPSGKLVVTFPYSVGQVPIYYNHPMTGRPAGKIRFTSKYIDGPAEPLYPFGYGLSYTTFEYKNLSVEPRVVSRKGQIDVYADVVNTGSVFGEEVVQLYIYDTVASRVRPVKELKAFKKIGLMPGECKKVHLVLNIEKLGFIDANLKYVVEQGTFKVYVGTNSQEGLEGEFVLTV